MAQPLLSLAANYTISLTVSRINLPLSSDNNSLGSNAKELMERVYKFVEIYLVRGLCLDSEQEVNTFFAILLSVWSASTIVQQKICGKANLAR